MDSNLKSTADLFMPSIDKMIMSCNFKMTVHSSIRFSYKTRMLCLSVCMPSEKQNQCSKSMYVYQKNRSTDKSHADGYTEDPTSKYQPDPWFMTVTLTVL